MNGSARIHGAISQKTIIPIVTIVRNWDLTKRDAFTVAYLTMKVLECALTQG
jgi:hypothetical protein